jgi:hypothetical protein
MAFGCFWFCGPPSDNSRRSFSKRRRTILPLLGGEGRGEGERKRSFYFRLKKSPALPGRFVKEYSRGDGHVQ